jgi:hypothetical protein
MDLLCLVIGFTTTSEPLLVATMTFKQVEPSVCHNEMTKKYQNFRTITEKGLASKLINKLGQNT